MNIKSYLIPSDISAQTQGILAKKIKGLIEEKASARGISVSEYLRRAALVVATLDDQEDANMVSLGRKMIGAVDLSKHPEWKDKKSVNKWLSKLRN